MYQNLRFYPLPDPVRSPVRETISSYIVSVQRKNSALEAYMWKKILIENS